MNSSFSFRNILLSLLVLVLLGNTFVLARLTSNIGTQLETALEKSRPARLSVVIIEPDDCEDCFDIYDAFEGIKRAHVDIEKEEILKAGDPSAQQLISQYHLEKLPTIVFTGEIDKDPQMAESWEKIGEIRDGAVVYTALTPPYYDISEEKVVGQVTITFIDDKSCQQCSDFTSFVQQLNETGVSVKEEVHYDYQSQEAQKLISQYSISHIPTLLLDEELSQYEGVVKDWSRVGNITEDGNYLVTSIVPPFRDLKSGGVRGLLSATYLGDKSCRECFDPTAFKKLFARFGLQYQQEETIDISSPEGKALLEKYRISSVPTMIFDEELDIYSSLKNSWSQIGTVERDGHYVVRKLSLMQGAKYKDLESGNIVSQ